MARCVARHGLVAAIGVCWIVVFIYCHSTVSAFSVGFNHRHRQGIRANRNDEKRPRLFLGCSNDPSESNTTTSSRTGEEEAEVGRACKQLHFSHAKNHRRHLLRIIATVSTSMTLSQAFPRQAVATAGWPMPFLPHKVEDTSASRSATQSVDNSPIQWKGSHNSDASAGDQQLDWTQYRYGTSSLDSKSVVADSTSETSIAERASRRQIPKAASPTEFPSWLVPNRDTSAETTIPSNYEYQYWLATYKFQKAEFPQGRDKISLRLGGAGLGTCMSLPNVGYSPSPFAVRFLSQPDQLSAAFEDHAYSMPRKFEAFWPQAKVTSIRIGGNSETDVSSMSPPCLVSGEGCTQKESPGLHLPSSRLQMMFAGPTRSRGVYRDQSSDQSLVYSRSTSSTAADQQEFPSPAAAQITRQYIQYNIEQDLQTATQELWTLEQGQSQNDGSATIPDIQGRLRVASFLPPWEASRSQPPVIDYDSALPLAVYTYAVKFQAITPAEAASY